MQEMESGTPVGSQERNTSEETNVFQVRTELKDLQPHFESVIAALKLLEPSEDQGRALRTRMKMERLVRGLQGISDDQEGKIYEQQKLFGNVLKARGYVYQQEAHYLKCLRDMIDLGMRSGPQSLVEASEDQNLFPGFSFNLAKLNADTGLSLTDD
ncbi:MAG: hypothetical protein HYY51_05050 [Candidatus Magasanikbacteria bacterium]|nr:hypothetical protein [Candidatus Magasanikbacteria bacterium]